MPAHSDPRGQDGQAIVETLVLAGIAGLLMLGIWTLGKFHDIQAATIQAARYAAWERTVQAPAQLNAGMLEQKARARLFAWNENSFRDDDGRRGIGTQTANWNSHSNRRLIARDQDIRITTTPGPLPGQAQAAVDRAFGMLTGALASVTAGEALPRGGMTTGQVQVRLADIAALPAPLNRLNLTLTESSAMVSEDWDASGPEQAAERSRSFVLAGAMAEAGVVLQPVLTALRPIEHDLPEFRPGVICPDIVPQDRVTNGRVRAMYQGAQPCY
jgi:hypothetical protein